MPKTDPRGKRVHSSLSRAELEALDWVVRNDGSNRSVVIRVALLEYLKRRKAKSSKAEKK